MDFVANSVLIGMWIFVEKCESKYIYTRKLMNNVSCFKVVHRRGNIRVITLLHEICSGGYRIFRTAFRLHFHSTETSVPQ